VRFASIGSGSRGNGTLVEAGSTCLLVDCGFSVAETCRRLARLERSADDITAVLVTHEHGDHLRGVAPLARRYGLPVWMTAGTAIAAGDSALPRLERINTHQPFCIGDIEIRPYPVPHDAREPTQFVFCAAGKRLGLLTDAGCITDHICRSLDGVDGLILETNHDEALLAQGPYPPALKRRVGGRLGHLSNRQAAALLEQIDTASLQVLVAAHISEKNNCLHQARAALSGALRHDPHWLTLADQDTGFDWQALS